mgnify:CR=1 FL=1
MHIPIGTRKTRILSELIYENCTNCGKYNTVTMTIDQEYLHVLCIPALPLRKFCNTQCSHCNNTSAGKEMPSNYQNYFESLKSNAKAPYWIYTGVILIALGAILITINDSKRHSNIEQYINSVQKGDFYIMRVNTGKYSLYKVDAVAGDTVYMKINTNSKSKISELEGLKKMDEDSNIIDESILKGKLLEFNSENKIVEVSR